MNHIAFNIDENYIPMCGVVIQSLIETNDTKDEYTCHILHNSVPTEKFNKLKSMETDLIKIELVDCSEFVEKVGIDKLKGNKDWITAEACFRLAIPEIFKDSGIDKILYLDCDIIICKNIKQIFEFDISDCCIAGARDVYCYALPYETKNASFSIQSHRKNYISSGGILMNIPELNKFKFFDKVLDLIKTDEAQKYEFLDQDIINNICEDCIKIFPTNFDYVSTIKQSPYDKLEFIKHYKDNINELEQFIADSYDPIIYHMPTKFKPWACRIDYKMQWHLNMLKSPFVDEFIEMWKDKEILDFPFISGMDRLGLDDKQDKLKEKAMEIVDICESIREKSPVKPSYLDISNLHSS